MKSVDLRLALDDRLRHPMHEFVAGRDEYGGTHLLHWSSVGGDGSAMIFLVDGPREPYVSAVEDVTSIERHHVSEAGRGAFYLYVVERHSDRERSLMGAFGGRGLVVLPPVEYRTDGTMALTAVGPPGDVQAAVDRAREVIDVEVRSVGGYVPERAGTGADLSPRQREAVAVAVAVGYYATPREATAADVGDELGCAASTAAEHLRKAEASIMSRTASSLPGTPGVRDGS